MKTAMYLRISSEDADLRTGEKNESESISNQRSLLRDYVCSHADLSGSEILEFCDDGWSGTNFERPAVKELLEQVKRGQINCIVVKDLSRFGRDYLTVGDYISRVFPFLGVRFISCTAVTSPAGSKAQKRPEPSAGRFSAPMRLTGMSKTRRTKIIFW